MSRLFASAGSWEGRNLRAVQAEWLRAAADEQADELERETSEPVADTRQTAAGDSRRLWGIPAVGNRIGSTIAGTQPEDALMEKCEREGW